MTNRLHTGSLLTRGLLVAALLAALPGPAGAAQTPVEPADEAVQRGVVVYEMALRGAVASGGQKLAQKAETIIPDMTLTTESPIVRSFRIPGYGLFFDVQAPDIRSAFLLIDMVQSVRSPAAPAGPAQQVAQAGPRTAATGVIEADPMKVSAGAFNPSAEYSAYVREALIDALLDSSGVLRLQDEEHLTISASGIDQRNPNALYRERKLIISIKAADLNAFRQNRITRDQAKERIVEDRF